MLSSARVKLVLGLAIWALSVLPAQAIVIDFEGSPDDYSDPQFHQGFTFAFTAQGWGVVSGYWVCCPGTAPVPDGTTRLGASGDRQGTARVLMSDSDGDLFSISGFDASAAFVGTSGTIVVTGFLGGGGTVSTTIAVVDAWASYSLDPSFSGLSSVLFAAGESGDFGSAGLALDDLRIDEHAVVAEPVSVGMLGLGLVGVALARRRLPSGRRQAANPTP